MTTYPTSFRTWIPITALLLRRKCRSQRLAALLFAVGCLLLAACLPAAAADNGGWTGLKPYTRTNSPAGTNKPPVNGGNGWTAVTNSTNGITVNAGATLCFGFLNSEDLTRRKYFRIEIDAVPKIDIVRLDFIDCGASDSNGNPVKKKNTGWGHNVPRDGALYWEFTFTPQPAWEWITFKNNTGHAIKITVKAWSVCALARPSFNSLLMQNVSFGAVGPGVMRTNQIIREVRIFPKSLPVNPSFPPNFAAPPNTGRWTPQIETADPSGNPRPLGWRFVTDGPGLAAGQPCSFSFQMQGTQADWAYTLYALDATTGAFQEFNVDLLAEITPDLHIRADVNTVMLDFDSAQGMHYLIETSQDLLNWQPFTTITGTGRPMSVPCPMTDPARYFRLKPLPNQGL